VEREERDAVEGRYGGGGWREGARMVTMAEAEGRHGLWARRRKEKTPTALGLVPPWPWSQSWPAFASRVKRTEGRKGENRIIKIITDSWYIGQINYW